MSTIVSLNGEWDFIWDLENVGLDHRWYVTCPEGLQKTTVPHIWESAYAKPGQVAFYFKRFTVDSAENAKRIYLRFNRIATQATFWLNGKFIGAHFGAYTPYTIDTSKTIKVGEENLLCIRVSTADNLGKMDLGRSEDEGSDRHAPIGELPMGLPWKQYPFAGIKGDVDLILGNRAFITGCSVTPNADLERITVDLQFSNPRNYLAKLRFITVNPRGEAAEFIKEIKLEKENHSAKIQLGYKDLEWWTPENPKVYSIEICLEKSFSVIRNFGFRKFDCIKGDFYLNDKVIRLQGLCYSQHNQAGGLWIDDLKATRHDLDTIKKLGFNLIRSGGAPLSDATLDLCDRMGIMVFQEFPIHNQKSSPRGLERTKAMTEELIEYAKSHPSVVAWVLGSENGTLMLENGTKLLKNVDQYDQTRPVFSNLNSVYLDNCLQFKKDTGKVMGVSNERILLYPSHRLHLRMNPNQTLSGFLANYCNKELPETEVPDMTLGDGQFQEDYTTFVQETHGKILVTLKNHAILHDLPATASKMKGIRAVKNAKALQTVHKQLTQFVNEGHGKGIWKNLEAFMAEANHLGLKSKLDQITALQSNPQVSGFFLDQWADCGTDLSGLVTENRESKGSEKFIKEITRGNRILISSLEHSVRTKSSVDFNLALLNESRLAKCEVSIKIIDDAGKSISSQKKQIQGQTSLTPLGEFKMTAPTKSGNYKLIVELHQGTTLLHTVEEPLLVLDAPDFKDAMKSVCFLDEAESSSDAVKHISGKEKVIFTSSIASWNESILERLAAAVKAGKTLFISDMNQDDVDTFNACSAFDHELSIHYTTGSNGLSVHYTTDQFLSSAFGKVGILGCTAAAIMPSMSLGEIEGSTIHARSIHLEDGELTHGVDLQTLPLGKGRLIFCQYSLLDNLENNALADQVFALLVKSV